MCASDGFALERPTALRQLGRARPRSDRLLTRRQGIILLPAYGTAILALATRRLCCPCGVPGGGVGKRPWIPREVRLHPGSPCGRGLQLSCVPTRPRAVAGRLAPRNLRGPSMTVSTRSKRFSGGLYHLGELDLYSASRRLPPSFSSLVCLRPRPVEHAAAPGFAALSLSLVGWLTVSVGAFASVAGINRIEERNLFYVAPL